MMLTSLKLFGVAILGINGIKWIKAEAHSEESIENLITELTPKDHEQFTTGNDNVMVLYHAPWCGHCKAMMPNFGEAAKRLRDEGNQTKLGKLDASKYADIAGLLDIRGFPTLFFYKKGQKKSYEGGRNTEDLVSWIWRMTGPPMINITEIEEARSNNPGTAHFILSAPENSEQAEVYYNIADINRGAALYYRHIDTKVSLRVMRHSEEDVIYGGDFSTDSVALFVNQENTALFTAINPENYKQYFDKEWPIAWVCAEQSWLEKMTPIFRQVATKYRGKLSFVFLDSEAYRGHAVQNLDVKEYPALVIHGNIGRYVMKHSKNKDQLKIEDEILDSEKVEQFCSGALDKTIPRHYKTEEIPTEDEGPVRVIVGKSFDELVINSPNDVLLDIFAPWCDHCKRLAPVLAEVAEAYKDNPGVIIAKMDGSANEAPNENFVPRGFPMIYWLKKGETMPQKYDGPRTLEALKEFVEQNRTKTGVAGEVTHEEL